MILSNVLILPTSQLQSQQVMTSLIRSHIEYLIQTYHNLVVKIDEKSSLNGEILCDLIMIRDSGLLFLGPPCRHFIAF